MKNKQISLFDEDNRMELLSKLGDPPYDEIIMFKILVLQQRYAI